MLMREWLRLVHARLNQKPVYTKLKDSKRHRTRRSLNKFKRLLQYIYSATQPVTQKKSIVYIHNDERLYSYHVAAIGTKHQKLSFGMEKFFVCWDIRTKLIKYASGLVLYTQTKFGEHQVIVSYSCHWNNWMEINS